MDTRSQLTRVLIADDHRVVRQGLKALLEEEPDVLVVGVAGDGVEAIELAQRTQPDVILLDLMMPRKSGLEAIPELQEVSPHSRILVLTSYSDDEKVFAAIKAGALSYLLKEITGGELCAAIQYAHQGLAWLHPAIARRLVRELNYPTTQASMRESLTDREAEALVLVARGLSGEEIARMLLIPKEMVYRHITNILTKFQQGPGPHFPLDPPLPLPIPIR